MKGQFFYLLFLTLSLPVIAQSPVINRDNLITIGDMYSQVVATTVPDEGAAGANATWDFSGVTGTNPLAFHVQDPAATPYASEFPDANVSLTEESGHLYQFQALNQESWEDHGYVSLGTIAFQLVYTEPRIRFQFPMTYLGSWSDDYVYVIDYQTNPPITTNGEGTVHAVVDGYGKLILPQATFDDVLRVKLMSESTDTSALGPGLYERNYFNDTTEVWLSPSWPAPICSRVTGSLLRITTVVQGGNTMQFEETETFRSFDYDPGAEPMPSAISEVVPGALHLQVTPNPFPEACVLTCHSDAGGAAEIQIFDATGSLLFTQQTTLVPGENTIPLHIGAITPGPCLVVLRTGGIIDVQKAVSVRQ